MIAALNHRHTKERDWQRGPEVVLGSYRSRASLVTIFAQDGGKVRRRLRKTYGRFDFLGGRFAL